jgi:hypothetical protein
MGIFQDLANTKVGDVEPPKLIPIGHYTAQITGQFAEHKAKSGNVAARFPFKVLAAGDTVDAEALAAAGGIPDKQYNMDFWMSPDALFRFTDFAKVQGVSESANLMEALEEVGTNGQPFTIEVKHQQDQNDPNKVYLRFDNPTAAA